MSDVLARFAALRERLRRALILRLAGGRGVALNIAAPGFPVEALDGRPPIVRNVRILPCQEPRP